MKKVVTILLLVLTCCTAPRPHTFEIANGDFLYDGKPTKIYSGEVHYARVPKEYWRHRLQMVKAMGLNAVCTYVFWNYHETSPGVWDFESGNRDLAGFIRTAQEEGLLVILRPGPYACAEWEFGGYPWWLQNNPELVIRANNKAFLDSCRTYINRLAEEVKELQVTKGGPLILVQVENEFGSYVSQRSDIPPEEHKKYNAAIHTMLKDAGFEVPFFTSDGSSLFEGGAIKGVLPTANGENNIDKLKEVVNQHNNNQGPYMVAELYPGWLDHWAEPFIKIPTDKIVQQTETYLKNGVSFNFYMAHGGTNFGFTSGANYNNEHDIQPDITSYDYDAPINEAGWSTEKYHALRALMKKSVPYKVPEIPRPMPVINPGSIKLTSQVNFFDWKSAIHPVESDSVLTFEQLGQGNGYVLYSKQFNKPANGKLTVRGLRDYATVYVNQQLAGVLNRVNQKYELEIDIPANGRLDILVENMGRINYGADIVFNTKGIISPVYLNGEQIRGWQMYRVPMNEQPAWEPGKIVERLPALYKGEFELSVTGDMFLNMADWGKGIVFVNGHHLGRYWNVGPQQTLYLPGCWLKKGKNEVVIFEQQDDQVKSALKTTDRPVLDSIR